MCALHVPHKRLYFDILTSPRKQRREMAKFEILWRTSAHDAERLLFSLTQVLMFRQSIRILYSKQFFLAPNNVNWVSWADLGVRTCDLFSSFL